MKANVSKNRKKHRRERQKCTFYQTNVQKEKSKYGGKIPLPVDNFSEMYVAEPLFICNFTA